MLQFYGFTEATHLKLHPFHCPIFTQIITQPSLSSGHSSRPLTWPLVPSNPSLPPTPTAPTVWTTPETSLTYHGLMRGLCICQNPNKKWTAHSRVTEENFIQDNSSLGEGLITRTVALRKEFIHHQEKAQQGRSQEVSPSPSPPARQPPDGFPIEWNHQEDRGKETGWCSPLKSSCWTLNRGKREFVFWKAAEFICLAS